MFVLLAVSLTTGVSFAHEPKVTRARTAEIIDFPGHATQVLAEFTDTDAGASVLALTIPPKTFGAPAERGVEVLPDEVPAEARHLLAR
jgi:hypothetical protein